MFSATRKHKTVTQIGYGTLVMEVAALVLGLLGLSTDNVVLLFASLIVSIVVSVGLATIVLRRTRRESLSPANRVGSLQQNLEVRRQQTAKPDGLTGLAGRDALREAYSSFLRDDTAPIAALLVCDVDHFKSVNDQFGHTVGDGFLIAIADVLQRQSSDAAAVARIGGDEFGVFALMGETQARAFAEFLQAEIGAIEGGWGSATLSFGIATTWSKEDWDAVLAAADSALYAAKTAGRNRIITESDYAESISTANRDELIVDFENRVRTYADRMLEGMLHRANELTQALRETAERDGLTGVYNREHLSRVFSREFEKAKKKGTPLSIVMIDLDDFGQFNKTRGFVTGDKVLVTAAATINSAVRANDWTARYGGEEFIVVMPDTRELEARMVATRIIEALRTAPFEAFDGTAVRVTGTAGVAELRTDDNGTEDLVNRASGKVIQGKHRGKDRVE